MTVYASDPRFGSIGGPTHGNFVPFIVYARIVPVIASGRRWEYWHDMERKAQAIEDILLAAGMNIATPVAYTPTFRQAPARVSIVGFWPDSTDPVAETLTPTAGVISSGTVEGQGTSILHPAQGTQTWGDQPTTANLNQTSAIKTAIEAAVATIPFNTWSFNIFYMDVGGVKYGMLNNKKAFFSFPVL